MGNQNFSIQKFTKDYGSITCYRINLPNSTVYLAENGDYIGSDVKLQVYLTNKISSQQRKNRRTKIEKLIEEILAMALTVSCICFIGVILQFIYYVLFY